MYPNTYYNLLKTNPLPNESVSLFGKHQYDLVIGQNTRSRPSEICRLLVNAYPPDFEAAVTEIDEMDFLVLLAGGSYSIHALTDPAFDPAEAIIQFLEQSDVLERIEDHPVSEAISLDQACTNINGSLAELEPDVAKALWASLAFIKDSGIPETLGINACRRVRFIQNLEASSSLIDLDQTF